MDNEKIIKSIESYLFFVFLFINLMIYKHIKDLKLFKNLFGDKP